MVGCLSSSDYHRVQRTQRYIVVLGVLADRLDKTMLKADLGRQYVAAYCRTINAYNNSKNKNPVNGVLRLKSQDKILTLF